MLLFDELDELTHLFEGGIVALFVVATTGAVFVVLTGVSRQQVINDQLEVRRQVVLRPGVLHDHLTVLVPLSVDMLRYVVFVTSLLSHLNTAL